jgi:hypothetical protein
MRTFVIVDSRRNAVRRRRFNNKRTTVQVPRQVLVWGTETNGGAEEPSITDRQTADKMTSVAAYPRQEPTTSVDESPIRAGALTSAVVDGDQAAIQALIFHTSHSMLSQW